MDDADKAWNMLYGFLIAAVFFAVVWLASCRPDCGCMSCGCRGSVCKCSPTRCPRSKE